MKKRSLFACFAVLCLVAGFSVPKSSGQAVYGSILGSVTDSQGSAVVGAKITVTSIAKGSSGETTTNDSGNYTISHLIPDVYNIRVEAAGFKSYDVKGVQVSADTSTNVDAKLDVGSVTQSIEVTGEIPQLKVDRSDVATSFTSQTIESVPIYNRNFTTFQLLSPGAQLQGWGHAASENPQGSRQILTNGQHFAGTGFELDGTDNQDPILGIIVINPNLDSINEVKITSQDYDAEFGKAIGAIVTSQTKSGTNEFHGSFFDFERSNSNFASDPFTQSKIGVPSGNWNQFGATFGGPIRKNKIFFFADYQGQRAHVGGSASDRILTQAEQGGNLSDLGKPIYDPYQTTDATHQTLVLDAKGQPIPVGIASRTQFPGNVIPASRLSQQTQNLLKLLPVGATLSDPTLNNFSGSGSNVLDSDNFDVRSDYVLNSKTQVFGRYSYQKFLRSGPGLFGEIAGGPALPADSGGQFAGTSNVRNQSLATGFDYTFGPTLLTDFRFGYMRYHVQTAPGGVGTTPAQDAGIPGLNIDTLYTTGMPYFHITTSGLPDFNFGYSLGANQCNCPLLESEHQYQFVNNWTKIHGNHTIKFGADIRYAYNLRVPSDVHRAGELNFSQDQTQGPGGVGGSGLAAFLLGDVTSFGRYVSASTNANETQPRFFFFGQDTIRVTNKLTVNLGLRWEIYKPESVRGTGQGGWVDPTTGEVRVAGQQGVDLTGNTSTDYKHFAPRVGIAYQVNPKTVVRLGYGRSYDIGVFGTVFGHAVTQNVPVLASQEIDTSNGQDFNTAFFLKNGPFALDPATALGGTLATSNCNAITDPAGVNPVTKKYTPTKAQCVGANGMPLLPAGLNAFVRPFNNRLPTVDAWNATVQRQLTPTISATISYVGNKGTHTIGGGPDYPFNNAKLAGYDPTLTGQAATDANNARKPFYLKYGWTSGFRYFGNDFNNKYNALQVIVEKRFANGLSFNTNYTFQHAVADLDGGTHAYDPAANYGPNDNYRNHVFIFTQVYQLPFGKGKRWGGDVGRVGDLLIGGWELNGTTNFSSGLPFTPGLSSCHASSDTGPCRPDKVGSIKDGPRSGDPNIPGYWFQTSAVPLVTAGQSNGPWAQPAVDTFGNIGRNSLRGPRYFDSDLSLFKNFTITERAKAQFQFQFYNIFNHVNLANPDGCVDCGSGGKITGIAANSQLRSLTYGVKLTF
ncbi:MAG TPA: TonB-dependent receptor [Candidatus Sulfotelmatobacter sp.]|jgi:outer membrane receptor protein involved in Fe transport|nr:TonB-dependent receptor [Candidatus Sulfotelmatobacter sp.]